MKRWFIIATLACIGTIQAQYLGQTIADFEAKFQVDILVDSIDVIHQGISPLEQRNKHGNVTVIIPGDAFHPQPRDTVLYQYLIFLDNELSKYPDGYLVKNGVEAIALGEKLYVGETKRSAIPHYRSKTLLYEASYPILYDETYMANVIHHELHHFAEYSLQKADKYYKKWNKINPKKFNYGYGGVMQFDKRYKNIDFTSHNHPREGFIGNYAMTGAEEDRAMIVALIMNERERGDLLKWLPIDERLRKKVELAIEILNELSGTTENYWTEVMVGH
ncbi:hypothetical protein SAMN05421640_1351 [Ekhidna lutea]|uniref:Peptidase n=1 Tax=Ekhidna lutea TaxID=447679 RepID=A0A239HJJ2_EKHLU|nr:hypothetical protein [Ekhidna lutea]SNS81520.1 hypothetical protein SAMN05421640_1351 [Ekhidna lutea]